MDDIITLLFLIVSVAIFSLAIAQLITKDRSFISKVPSLLFFVMAYLCLYFWMYRAGILNSCRRLVYSDVAVTYLFGPILYSYVRSLLEGAPKKRSVFDYFQYFPAIGVFLFLFIYNPGELSVNLGGGHNPDYRENTIVYVLNTLADSTFFVYTLFSALKVNRIKKDKALVTDAPMIKLYRMLVFSLGTYVLFFWGHLKRSDGVISIAVLLNGLNCAFYLFSTAMYPEYTKKIITELRTNRKKKGLSADSVSPPIIDEIKTLFERERIYRDPELSIQSLSIRLNIKNHQLTAIFNQQMNIPFKTFVNNYRIEEAKVLLAASPAQSIISIAYQVGFNSKSVFNDTFRKSVHQTPTDFRQKMSPVFSKPDDISEISM